MQTARGRAQEPLRFEAAMQTAREALQQKRYGTALSALEGVRELRAATGSRSYAALREQASAGVRREAAYQDACREFA